LKSNGNGNPNGNYRDAYRNRFGRVQYPKGIAPRSQTGIASSTDFLDRPMV
jgi:hypothetical protein